MLKIFQVMKLVTDDLSAGYLDDRSRLKNGVRDPVAH
jgi:hypothetical protein